MKTVITNGDTGVAQNAWSIARKWGYATTGKMPHGFLTALGVAPELATLYGAVESRSAEPGPALQYNVMDSQVALWLGQTSIPEFQQLNHICNRSKSENLTQCNLDRRVIIVDDMFERLVNAPLGLFPIRDVLMGIDRVYIAGPNHIQEPFIGQMVATFLDEVFKLIQWKSAWDRKQQEKPKRGFQRKKRPT